LLDIGLGAYLVTTPAMLFSIALFVIAGLLLVIVIVCLIYEIRWARETDRMEIVCERRFVPVVSDSLSVSNASEILV
jgi:predicted permease